MCVLVEGGSAEEAGQEIGDGDPPFHWEKAHGFAQLFLTSLFSVTLPRGDLGRRIDLPFLLNASQLILYVSFFQDSK